jgi:pilus assembly protein CpaF
VAPSLAQLQAWGAVDEPARQVLEAVVAARLSYVVTGGTGSGKTTLLAGMLSQVAPRERVVVVEDVRELSVDHPHVVHLQGRSNNVEGRGEVTLTTLVRQSLRMRPDRIVVGEVRGAEVRELLAALNTGHEGGCGTLHANAAADLVSRVEALGALAAMSPAAVHAQLASAVQVVLHVARTAAGRRALTQVAVLERADDGRVRTVAALEGGPGRWRAGPAWARLRSRLSVSSDVTAGDACLPTRAVGSFTPIAGPVP